MEKTVKTPTRDYEGLIALVRILRSEDGCPWDREQTPEQIQTYLLEEAYEVCEAIASHDPEEICCELGDLLFHIIFLARIFEETGDFTLRDVVSGITEKMIRRHPHVFGEARVSGTEEVRRQWHEIKMAENAKNGPTEKKPFGSVPGNLPALMRAYRVSERAAKSGLCEADVDTLLQALESAVDTLKETARGADENKQARQVGHLLFATIELARLLNVHPEGALTEALREFEGRHQPCLE